MKNNMMRDFIDDLDPELTNTAEALERLAQRIDVKPAFQADLERQLITAHQTRGVSRTMFPIRKLVPVLISVMALAILVIVLDWAIRSIAPQPIPAAGKTPVATSQIPTAAPEPLSTQVESSDSYNWNGTTLYLSLPLPDSQADANVYLAQADSHATAEEAIALAQRFGINGEVYQGPGEISGTTDYTITDGKQSLLVRSSHYFSYTADMAKAYNNLVSFTNPDAETIIGDFLRSRGFDFPYKIDWTELRYGYIVQPLAPDGIPLSYENYSPPPMLITLDESGQVFNLQASLMGIKNEPVGSYGILTAQEALQKMLQADNITGMIEGVHSASKPIQQWRRVYPVDQTLTIYGNVSSAPAVNPSAPPLIQIDGYAAVGKITGMDQFSQLTYVEATGQFVIENGIERFQVETWKVSDVNEDGFLGTLQRGNGQVTLTTTEGDHYLLADVPDDVPMPFENAYVIGTKTGDSVEWKLIDDRIISNGGGGGGGGGGIGFHKLNLSGTPVPFSTSTTVPTISSASGEGQSQYVVRAGDTFGSIAQAYGISSDELMRANGISDPGTLFIGQVLIMPGANPQPIDGLRGMLAINIYKQPDGSQRVEYALIANATSDPGGYILLEGDGLQALQAYNNRPVDIWGTVVRANENGIPAVRVDQFKIPFPDLKFQILRGTQKLAEISGQQVTLFTTDDGTTFIQLLADGTTGSSMIGNEGNQVLIEALAIPDESVGGYPALRIFGGSLAINPKNGQPANLSITADQPSITELPTLPANVTLPTANIEKIELVYFISDLRYVKPDENAAPAYIQPAWRFHGHYSNGDEFEVLIQALKQEFLLPELAPYVQGG